MCLPVGSDCFREATNSSLHLPLVERHQLSTMLVVLSKNESISNRGRAISVHGKRDVICLGSFHTILLSPIFDICQALFRFFLLANLKKFKKISGAFILYLPL